MSTLRRSSAVALVAFGAFLLVVTALCPRGMLRALAASELDRPAAPSGVVLHDDGGDDQRRLPGVRVAVAREDDDLSERSLVLASAVAVEIAREAAPPERPPASAHHDDEPCPDAPSARPCAERAPPRQV